MKIKRIVSLILALSLMLALAACGSPAAKPTEAPAPTETQPTAAPTAAPQPTDEPAPTEAPAAKPETVEYTDDTGRTLTIPGEITKIAITGPMSQIVLFALAPEKLVAVANAWDKGAEAYFQPEYFNLPVLGQLYGGKGELNLEELLAAAPQIVLDVGEPKKSIGEDLEALTEQTGIPFLHIDGYTASMGDAYRMLGDLLGLEEKAAVLADYCDEIYAFASGLEEKLAPEKKKTALYLLGDSGLNVIASGSFHAEMLNLIVENAAVLENPSSKGTGNETDMEQLMLWDPEVIFFAPDSVYDKVGDDPAWQELQAIRNSAYYRVPYGPYNWMGFPPSVQRYLGVLWAAKLLYPEAADYDLYTEIARYYKLFYGCDLTRAQFDALMG